ncbi:MAG: hypothetical protein FWD17_03385 [Polyangiaceae bacterium]|nr:hypothetical protein [Polyangiaceae bacterium]
MKTRVDERLRIEAARFAFLFACEDCAHFDGAVAPAGRCSLGFSPAPRRGALDQDSLESCKTFELG